MFDRAKILHEIFYSNKDKINWVVIDNTSLSIEETLNTIVSAINKE